MVSVCLLEVMQHPFAHSGVATTEPQHPATVLEAIDSRHVSYAGHHALECAVLARIPNVRGLGSCTEAVEAQVTRIKRRPHGLSHAASHSFSGEQGPRMIFGVILDPGSPEDILKELSSTAKPPATWTASDNGTAQFLSCTRRGSIGTSPGIGLGRRVIGWTE